MVGRRPVMERRKFYSLLFTDRQALLAKRRQKLSEEEYRKRCHLRAAVEGTVSQFKQGMHNGKLRVRGYKRVRNAIILMAIGINFGRMWAYIVEKGIAPATSLLFVTLLLAILVASLGGRMGAGRVSSPGLKVNCESAWVKRVFAGAPYILT